MSDRTRAMAAHPSGKNSFRVRARSTFIVRYDAILTVIVASVAAFVLGMGAQWQLTVAADPWHGVPQCTDAIADAGGTCHGEPLPPCPTEDSDGCYWDADTMGDGTGIDVVTP